MSGNRLDPRLLADCHHLGTLDVCEVLLNRNALLPWFILVPHTDLPDVLDLPASMAASVLDECAAISAFIKGELGYSKVNFAGLGNVVPQMHLHIIGRSKTDACWPQPVWGALPDGPDYDLELLRQWQIKLTGIAPFTASALD